jgi:hypothetical protein
VRFGTTTGVSMTMTLLVGCSSGPTTSTAAPGSTPGDVTLATPTPVTEASGSTAAVVIGRAGVLLPPIDDPRARWQRAHRSQLAVALGAVGLEPLVENVGDAGRGGGHS